MHSLMIQADQMWAAFVSDEKSACREKTPKPLFMMSWHFPQ